jgi:hypothetical protein
MAFPAAVDRYLARKGMEAQQTRAAIPAGRHDNLFAAIPGLHRTRGSFGKNASSSVVLWSGRDVRRAAMGTLAALSAIAAAGILARSAVRHRRR